MHVTRRDGPIARLQDAAEASRGQVGELSDEQLQTAEAAALLAQREHDDVSAVQQFQVLSDDVDGILDDEQQVLDEEDDEDEE